MDTTEPEEEIDVGEGLATLQMLMTERDEAEGKMLGYLECRNVGGTMSDSTRFNVQLDERYAAKLGELAERTHVSPGTLACSLLSTALDEADPDPASIVALLDSIPGAFERAQRGLAEVRSGEGIPLAEL